MTPTYISYIYQSSDNFPMQHKFYVNPDSVADVIIISCVPNYLILASKAAGGDILQT